MDREMDQVMEAMTGESFAKELIGRESRLFSFSTWIQESTWERVRLCNLILRTAATIAQLWGTLSLSREQATINIHTLSLSKASIYPNKVIDSFP
jgi:hypothetical protein